MQGLLKLYLAFELGIWLLQSSEAFSLAEHGRYYSQHSVSAPQGMLRDTEIHVQCASQASPDTMMSVGAARDCDCEHSLLTTVRRESTRIQPEGCNVDARRKQKKKKLWRNVERACSVICIVSMSQPDIVEQKTPLGGERYSRNSLAMTLNYMDMPFPKIATTRS